MQRYVASPRSPPHLRHSSTRPSHRHHPYRTGGRPLRRHDSTRIDIPGAFPVTPNASAASIDVASPTDTSRTAAPTWPSYPRASGIDGLASGQHTTAPSASQPGSDDHILQYEFSKARMRVADLERSLQSLGTQLRNVNAEKAAQAEDHRLSFERLSADAATPYAVGCHTSGLNLTMRLSSPAITEPPADREAGAAALLPYTAPRP
ncbi:hypothetical protein FB107DRAFT_251685 [Schizophyllum commune]